MGHIESVEFEKARDQTKEREIVANVSTWLLQPPKCDRKCVRNTHLARIQSLCK